MEVAVIETMDAKNTNGFREYLDTFMSEDHHAEVTSSCPGLKDWTAGAEAVHASKVLLCIWSLVMERV